MKDPVADANRLTVETVVPAPWCALLSKRQHEVLAMLHEGVTNKEIGRRLAISENTVRAHLAAVFRTLQVGSREKAAAVWRGALGNL